MPRLIRAIVAALAAALVISGGVVAQDATPSPSDVGCDVEPYDLTTVLTPAVGTPAAEPTGPVERPTGEPADDEVVAGVTETVDQFIACYNGGYRFRIFFLFTPEGLQAFIADSVGPLTAEQIAQLNEEAASAESLGPLPADQQTVIESIEDVEVLDDGRIVATVIGDDLAQPEDASPVYFIFEEVDGRYLIDAVIDPEEDATPEA